MAATYIGTKYDNADWTRCARTGGLLVVICDGTGVGQGNGGTDLDCRGCWVATRDSNMTVKMAIGTPASAVFGVTLAEPGQGGQPLWVPVSNVAQLYFYGIYNAVIDIVYLLG